MSRGIKIKKEDWERILAIMRKYQRNDGYVDFDYGGNFCFFDSDPMLEDVGACYITREEVEKYINTYQIKN
jgi:hypothetical protein